VTGVQVDAGGSTREGEEWGFHPSPAGTQHWGTTPFSLGGGLPHSSPRGSLSLLGSTW